MKKQHPDRLKTLLMVWTYFVMGAAAFADLTEEEIAANIAESKAEQQRFKELVDRSDLIVVGAPETWGVNSSLGSSGITLRITVSKVLKGPANLRGEKLVASYGGYYRSHEDPAKAVRSQAPKGKMVVFLKRAPEYYDSDYAVVDQYFGVLPYSSTVEVGVGWHVEEDANARKKENGEQGGAGQPATRPESDSEGDDKPKPESEGRSR